MATTAETGPEALGTTDLWMARMALREPLGVQAVQAAVESYTAQSGITVVGYYREGGEKSSRTAPTLTLQRWPDSRPGYSIPAIGQCRDALFDIAGALNAEHLQEGDVAPNHTLHAVMGRVRDGYDGSAVDAVPIDELRLPGLMDFSVEAAHMVSARAKEDGTVEPYSEPVGVIEADPRHERAVHYLGHTLRQHHYAIERTADGVPRGRTTLYQTGWGKLDI